MMRWIAGAALKSRGLVVALGVAVMIVGFVQFRDMPRDALPEFRPPTVEIQTEALGLSAPEVEQLITVPLEQDLLDGVAFLDVIRSQSVAGISRIELIFEPGTELAKARQVVNERLTQAHGLPQVSQPPQMLQPLSSTSRVMMVGLSSKKLSLIDLSVLARWTIRPRLMGVSGVANVAIWGQREQQLQVQVDPVELQTKGVGLDRVIRTTGNALWSSPLTFLEASTPGVGGFFDTQSQRLGVQHKLPIRTPEDLARVPVEDESGGVASGTPQRLGDVATIVEDHQPLIGDAVLSDGPGLFVVVEKLPEANALDVTRDLQQALDGLKPGLGGVEVDTSAFQPARYIEQSTENLGGVLLIGLVLLVFALGALLFDWRAAVVSLVALAVSLAGAIALLSLRGETINAMVLAGLVLALVVLIDDSVIGGDAIRRRFTSPRQVDGRRISARAITAAVVEVRGPLGYATAIILLALLPIVVLTGETGAFLPPLALSYAGAVIVSMLVALTITPALGSLLLGKATTEPRESPAVRWLRPRYGRAVTRFAVAPRIAFISVGALLVLGIAATPLFDRGASLIPEFKDRDVLVHWNSAPGTSLPEMNRITRRAASELRSLPGVETVGAHVGRAILGDQIVGSNSGELWVAIKGSADHGTTLSSIEEVVSGYPGIEHAVLTYPRERIDSVLVEPDGVEGKDLTVRLFGPKLDTLRAQADELKRRVAKIDGVAAPRVELPIMEPTLEVEVDLDRAQALGIKPGDVRRAAATLLSGIQVGSLFEEQKIFDVVVWGTPETRSDLTNVRGLTMVTPSGGSVRLDEVADVRVVPSPNVIRHEDVSLYLDLGVDVSGREVGAVASDIRNRIRDTGFPLEYHAEVLRDYKARASSRLSFIGAAMVALLGVFLLLQAAFRSWRMAAAVFVALAAALSGGAVLAVVDGSLLSIGTLVGFFAVFGLAARNSIVLVRRGQDLEDLEGETFGPELVGRAARERMVPTLVTAVGTGLVFLPLLVFGGQAGHELARPMATVILGGLVTATFVSLFVLPALYLRFGRQPVGGRERIDEELDLTAEEATYTEAARDVVPPPTPIDA
jgi:Cu/Ag efflux pump CusA